MNTIPLGKESGHGSHGSVWSSLKKVIKHYFYEIGHPGISVHGRSMTVGEWLYYEFSLLRKSVAGFTAHILGKEKQFRD